MVLGRPQADEQPFGDLLVRASLGDEREHLPLPAGQGIRRAGGTTAPVAEGAQQTRGRVGITVGAQRFERAEGGAGLGHGELRLSACEHGGVLEVAASRLPAQPRGDEGVHSLLVGRRCGRRPVTDDREARRVLRPAGRLALSVCRSIEHQPAYIALSEVVTRHVGVEGAAIVRSPYAFGDREVLRTVVSDAGFRNVDVRTDITTVRFSCSTAFLGAETGSSPLGDLLAQVDEDVRQELTDDLEDALDPFTDDRGVVFPFETHLLTATA